VRIFLKANPPFLKIKTQQPNFFKL
jgi:hypothetical protein